MYLQITTLCNMACTHCSFSCSPTAPYEHMNRSVFIYALCWCENYGNTLTIGGGEPTVHPEFWDYLKKAITFDIEEVWLATNGKRTQDAIALAKLASNNHNDEEFRDYIWSDNGEEIIEIIDDPRIEGTTEEQWSKFNCALSQDKYHEPINPIVLDAFSIAKLEIRDVTKFGQGGVSNLGTAKLNQIPGVNACSCSTLRIKPDGTVTMCGCPDSIVLGHITDEILPTKVKRIQDTEDDHDNCGYFGLDKHTEQPNIKLINHILKGTNYTIY